MWKKKTKLCTSLRPSARFRALLNSLLLRLPRSKARPQGESVTGGRGKAPCTPVSGGESSVESNTLLLSGTLSQIRSGTKYPSRVLSFADYRRDNLLCPNPPVSTGPCICG